MTAVEELLSLANEIETMADTEAEVGIAKSIKRIIPELEKDSDRLAALERVLRDLTTLRENTDMTYEDAYHSMFKGLGAKMWDAAREALSGAPKEAPDAKR